MDLVLAEADGTYLANVSPDTRLRAAYLSVDKAVEAYLSVLLSPRGRDRGAVDDELGLS